MRLCIFDPQYCGLLDKVRYGNKGVSRGQRRWELPQMSEETFTEFISQNTLIFGDNLQGLRTMRCMGITADLVYIDPPYATGNKFLIDEQRANSISASGTLAYSDRTKGKTYLEQLEIRISAIREVMADEGSIFVHIGINYGHYVRLVLDRVFGVRNHQATISRIKCNPKNFRRKSYGNIHDILLHYSKHPERFTYRPEAVQINQDEAALMNLPFKRAKGVPPQDVWVFKDPQRPTYPTQKNSEMLKRIITAHSEPGQTVLDCYAGSGATLVVAAKLQRTFVGMDQSPAAERVITNTLTELGVKFRSLNTSATSRQFLG